MSNRRKLFISYSHRDSALFGQLKDQLKVLETQGLLGLCDDTQLEAGTAWYEELHEKMLSAKLGLLLVSATFLTSPFVLSEEVPRLFSQHQNAGMRLYPLLVRPCAWDQVGWLSKLQMRPQDANRQIKAVSAFTGAARQQVLVNVAKEIATIVQ